MGLTVAIPAMLIGLLGAGIPVALHLYSRVRSPEMVFPTLRFLKLSVERTARRRRIQNALLMLVRAALLALLAFALSQPFMKGAALSNGADTAAAVVLDNSRSMGLSDAGPSRYSEAQRAFADLLASSDAPAHIALAFTNGPESRVAVSLQTADRRAELSRRVLSSTVSAGYADLKRAIEDAYGAIADSTLAQKVVYVLTDAQAAGLPSISELPDPIRRGDVELRIIDCGREDLPNVGVTAVRVEGLGRVAGGRQRIIAVIQNGGTQAATVGVGLEIEGRRLRHLDQRISLARDGRPGSRREVLFEHVFASPGWVRGRVVLDAAEDADPLDDVRHFAIKIDRPIQAVVLAPPPIAGARSAAFFVMQCLRVAGTIEPTLLTPREFRARDLDDTDVLIWCDVPRVPVATAAALPGFFSRGGRLMIFVGPNVEPASYNRKRGRPPDGATAWMPAQLAGVTGARTPRDEPATLTTVDTSDPLFARLYERPSQFQRTLVHRYFNVRPFASDDVAVLATLSDGKPLVVTRRVRPGRVMLVTTTADTSWSNLAIQPIFLPVLLRFALAGGDDARQAAEAVAGELVTLGADNTTGREIEVQTPPSRSGRSATLRISPGPDGTAVLADSFAPGIYRWSYAGDELDPNSPATRGATALLALNPDGRETRLARRDLSRWNDAADARVYVAADFAMLQSQISRSARGTPLWDVLLFVVLVAAICETLLANRYRPEAGVPSASPPRAKHARRTERGSNAAG